MAIVKADVELWQRLKEAGQLPERPHVLEIGEANWFGDAEWPGSDNPYMAADPFAIAKDFYRQTFNYASITSIDLQGTPAALPLDLNKPISFYALDMRTSYDIVINTGTTEHVFDQRQVFQTIHEACKVGGLIVHNAPHQAPEHGFYSYSRCFFDDIAAANGYELLHAKTAVLDERCGTIFHLAYRKTRDEPFRVPRQRGIGL